MTDTKTEQPDVTIRNEGSLILFRPTTEFSEEWLRANTAGMWFGGALVVEPRYAADLARGLVQAGFSIK